MTLYIISYKLILKTVQFAADTEIINTTLLTQFKSKIKKETEITDILKRKQQQQLINILKEKLDSTTVMNKILKQNISVTMHNLLKILLKL